MASSYPRGVLQIRLKSLKPILILSSHQHRSVATPTLKSLAFLPHVPLLQPSTGKRKLEDAEADDPHSKIRRIVRDHVSQDPARVMPMTTVICLHAAVAQKSYGSEKRFLCPPPVVHIEGPLWHMRSQQLSMAVVSESGERSFEQKAPLDNNMTASFKFLHVTGTAKAKSFQLSLDIAEPSSPSLAPDNGESSSGRVWATFDSAPVTIISKPSKKTAKTRNISSCILAGGPVSLFNRINSQTVRTKYMTIDHAQLCASNVAWSAFNVNVVRRPGGETHTVGTCHVMRIITFPALTLLQQRALSQSLMGVKLSYPIPILVSPPLPSSSARSIRAAFPMMMVALSVKCKRLRSSV